MALSVIILAAGQGTRMRSSLPKVLHPLAGKPLVQHVIDTSKSLGANNIYVVYGHGGEMVQKTITEPKVTWVEQKEQLGTGHAVDQVSSLLNDEDDVLILYGDVPLIHPSTLNELLDIKPEKGIALLTVTLPDPTGYGRIIRNDNDQVVGIVEQKDANEEQLAIAEVNTGIMAANGGQMKHWLSQLSNDNAQGEYYLTDVIGFAANEGQAVQTASPVDQAEVEGVNNRLQLAQLECAYQQMRAKELLLGGVTLIDPHRFDLRGKVTFETDVTIDVNVILEGHVILKSGATIGANCILKNCTIGENTVVKPNSMIEDSIVGSDCTIGPFARLRPGTELLNDAHIGNFVEVKKSVLGSGSKANHLAYIGDAEIGNGVNVGAGTITCNYDGANKHKTIIKDGAFIGSDTQLVAPVTIGENATVGAGATITSDVSDGVLCVSRVKQKEISNWVRPQKNKD
ncbi:bifunctional UDP-N-acetylglucosamine diphosphorylase/glucosamine-1-phosphate N-acetyltransferase GlmU [Pleionea sp. CnH1-48]|uniref:bifunctional UDP-N-acetylglucosamine diphosphorylase/glucosamine-1-phosphate N-acetyltransferase GlmU n=1 Tax=Pleionea sp. CnH1-48 TaxID=2954494 RepID=UPI002097BBCC|nr:bifunctional UDP-N-acetylglucosamine diphosphorylase/glucosamine-1-phosphate N-acetyltransferase GlmU [Pleionea sp. CnH1-48]MCO7226599.1 bifunctional UDP-N-acetylglucosamine diphosphorylase/glucosamine-1-phosphate N-acetyltransferase GlmU [Pleionea sp. CnH1-48]